LLCLLWSLGIFTYKKESPNLSAVALALGTAIKLTPVLAVIPFLVCREWKWLRAYLLSLIVLIAAMVMLNGPASLLDYQVHVLPSMSAGYPDPYNFSISSAFRLLYLVVRRPPSFTSAAPQAVATLCSVLTVAVTCWMIRKRRETLSQREWWAILAAISMLSVSLAPVSFQQAYIVVAFPLGFLWLDLLRGGLRPFFTPVVIAATLEYATFATKIFRNARFAPIGGGLCALIPPAVGIVIALLCIARAPDPQSQLVPKLVKTDRNEAIAGPA
jgi:cell division protein FtsW (lipid II flippase)